MKLIVCVGFFSLLLSLNVMTQVLWTRDHYPSKLQEYDRGYSSLNVFSINKSVFPETTYIYWAQTKIKFGFKAGTAFPMAEYASGGQGGGYAEFGYSVGVKLLYDIGILLDIDITYTSNPFEIVYSEGSDIVKDSYESIWCLGGFGISVELSPDAKLIGLLEIGSLLSKRPEYIYNKWRDSYSRRKPQNLTYLGYGADVFCLLKEHYLAGLRCFYSQTENEYISDEREIIRPEMIVLSVYLGYFF